MSKSKQSANSPGQPPRQHASRVLMAGGLLLSAQGALLTLPASSVRRRIAVCRGRLRQSRLTQKIRVRDLSAAARVEASELAGVLVGDVREENDDGRAGRSAAASGECAPLRLTLLAVVGAGGAGEEA